MEYCPSLGAQRMRRERHNEPYFVYSVNILPFLGIQQYNRAINNLPMNKDYEMTLIILS